jgi:REP-associated tyrosine transposase
MARRPRLEFPGAVYHVAARGNDKRAIFHDDRDRQEYLDRIDRYRKKFHFQLLAYCLMRNHVHLAIRTGEEPLSRIMAGLQSSFTQWFNRRHDRVGHFFQGRYKAFLVQEDRYFAALLRYIHMNPVKAGLVQRPQDYPWSSDRLFRVRNGPLGADRAAALALLAPTAGAAAQEYRRLMRDDDAPDYTEVNEMRNVKGDEEFALERIRLSARVEPVLRGVSEHSVLRAVSDVTGIAIAALMGPARGGPIASARFLAGHVAKRTAAISLASMARHLGREESYLLKGVARLEGTAVGRSDAGRIEEVVRRLLGGKSGFLD